MKKLLGLLLAVALVVSLVTVAPSFADPSELLNVDWIETTDGSGNRINLLTGAHGGIPGSAAMKGAMFGELSDDVAAGAQYIHFIGWYMPLAELADVGVSIDGADPVYGGFMTSEDGLFTALAANDNVSYVRRINFYYPIQEGSHTFDLVAKFTNDSTKIIYSGYYSNGGNVALNKPVYATLSTVPAGGACFHSDNGFWNISFINDGSATLFTGATEPLGWYAASATADVDCTVTIDLQGQYDVTRVNLLAMGFNNAAFPNTYRVLASADGVNWQDIGGEEGVAANFFDKIATYDTNVTARYIRIYITKFNPVDVYYAGLGEVEVFGTLKEEDNTRSIFEPFTSYDAGTAATADPGGNAAWTGFSTGDLDFEFTFKTDVSFWKIEFPGFWSSAATPVTFTFYQDGVEVHSFDYTTVGDGAISLPIGTTLPAGKYTCVMTINDNSVNAETGNYNKYVVLGYATAGKLLDDEYFTFERGKIAFNIYSYDIEGEGFVKLHTPETRDFSADAGDKLSFDTIYVNGVSFAEGNPAIIAAKKLIDGSDGSITSIGLRGWYGNKDLAIDQFGYMINGGEPVFGEYKTETEAAVLDSSNGGQYASRFEMTIDVSEFAKDTDYEIRAVAKLSNGDVVILNRVDNPGTEQEKDRDIYVIYRSEATPEPVMTWVTTGKIVNTDTFAIVDGSGNTVATPASKTELGQLKSTVAAGGTKIKQYGWVYPEKAILTIGYMTDDGDITWGIEYYDQAIVDAFNASSLPYAALALRFDTSRVNGGAPILEGTHTYKLVVKYTDDTYEVLHSATYFNNDELVPEWVALNPTSQNTVGLWLNQADSYAMAAFTANSAFEAVKIPVAWSSIPSQSKAATFEFALYAFDDNFDKTLEGTPIATVTRTPAGDEATGYTLEFEEQEAGEYVIVVKIISLDAEAYTVLPVNGDEAGALYKLNKAFNATSFNFAVKTKYPTDFFGDVPQEYFPPYVPVTRDFSADAGDKLSYDTIYVNDVSFAEGNAAIIAAKKLIDGSDGSITSIGLRGWYGNKDLAIDQFGYMIDGGEPVFGEYKEATEPAVLDSTNGGQYASRFTITVDVSEFAKDTDYEIRAVAKLSNGDVVILNRVDNPGTEQEKDRDIYVIYRSEATPEPGLTWVTTGKIVNTDTFDIVDEAGNKVVTPASKTELGQLKSTVAAGGTKIKQYGWIYPEKAILTIGFMTDDGDITWGIEYYDQNIVDVFTQNALPNAALSLRFDTSRAGNVPILEGVHTYKLVVKYSDDTYEVLHSATYSNNDDLVAEWVSNNPSSQNTVGLWLNTAESTAYAAFTANSAFDAIKIPVAWSSVPAQSKAATFEFSIYKFSYNIENSVKGTPLATITRTPAGDEASGYSLEFNELPAGEYVIGVKIVSLDAEAYTVLPVLGDASKALYKLNKAFNAETFNFAVRTLYPEEFFGNLPVETEAPLYTCIGGSFDSFYVDGVLNFGQGDGLASSKLDAVNRTVESPVETFVIRGWIGFEEAIEAFGYKIGDADPVYDASFLKPAEEAVQNAGGKNAKRFEISVPVSDVTETSAIVAVVKLANGEVVVLDGSAAAAGVDVLINTSFTYSIKAEVPEGSVLVDPETVEIKPGEDVVINVPTGEGSDDVDGVVLDGQTVGQIIANGEESNVAINLSDSTIVLDGTSIGAIAQQSSSADAPLAVSVKGVDDQDLTQAQQQTAQQSQGAVVYRFDATIGTAEVTTFGNGNVAITVPYTIPSGIDSPEVRVAIITDDGQTQDVEATFENGKLTFNATQPATFMAYVVSNPIVPPTADTGVFATVVVIVMLGALVAVLAIRRKESE
ncbi:MAG: discoidin domain-containing protein [Clostridia bacterium]|nr:discoidin domain-containing protein [Clostridia bacterium]